MRILGPPFHCPILPENRSNCFTFYILHQPLISGTKGFQTGSVWIWLVGFTETCSGHSLSVIIISQLPLDNGKKNLKFQPSTWLAGIIFCISDSKHPCTAAITDWGRRGFRGQSPQAQVQVPALPLWFGQVLCWIVSSHNSYVQVLTPSTLFRNRVAAEVIS